MALGDIQTPVVLYLQDPEEEAVLCSGCECSLELACFW